MTYETVGVDTGTSEGLAIAANASADTKSTTWIEIDASTSIASDGLWVVVGPGPDARQSLMDIATGAVSSEVILINNLLYSTGDGYGGRRHYFLPMSIASGTRLSAKVQASVGGVDVDVAIILTTDSGLDITAFANVDTIGAVTSSDSQGTVVDAGASTNTKGVYVEFDASTSNTYKALMIAIGQNNNNGLASAEFLFDVAIGASESEVDFLSNIGFKSAGGSDTITPMVHGPMACDIPSSSRLTVRMQSSTSNATDRVMDFILYGFY